MGVFFHLIAYYFFKKIGYFIEPNCFLDFSDGCNDEFICFNSLYYHLKVIHPGDYKCFHCFADVKCELDALADHFTKNHNNLFSNFHCIHCDKGFEDITRDITEIKEHMSENHASEFLLVAARMSARATEEDDVAKRGQLVYIGDMLDSSQHSLVQCCDFEALSYMNPDEMDSKKQLEMQQIMENREITRPFRGTIPPISFTNIVDGNETHTSKDYFMTYAEYEKQFIKKRTCTDGKVAIETVIESKVTIETKATVKTKILSNIQQKMKTSGQKVSAMTSVPDVSPATKSPAIKTRENSIEKQTIDKPSSSKVHPLNSKPNITKSTSTQPSTAADAQATQKKSTANSMPDLDADFSTCPNAKILNPIQVEERSTSSPKTLKVPPLTLKKIQNQDKSIVKYTTKVSSDLKVSKPTEKDLTKVTERASTSPKKINSEIPSKNFNSSPKKANSIATNAAASNPESKNLKSIEKDSIKIVKTPSTSLKQPKIPESNSKLIVPDLGASTSKNKNPTPPTSTVSPKQDAKREWIVKFACISTQSKNEIMNNQQRKYKSGLCKDCNKFIKVESRKDYLNHLMDSSDHVCSQSAVIEKAMVTHRMQKHKKSDVFYLKMEQSSDLLVYKLIRNQFKCETCGASFKTHSEVLHHNNSDHTDSYLAVRIVQNIRVIESNDPKQPINSETEESDKFCWCNMFFCNLHSKTLGNRTEALYHFNMEHKHHSDIFKCSFRQYVLAESPEQINHILNGFNAENKSEFRLHVFECLHCNEFFDSVDSAASHIKNLRREKCDPQISRFTVNKLYACHDKECFNNYHTVGPYDRLKKHYTIEHSNAPFTPVAMIRTRTCGLCDYVYSSSEDLQAHYERVQHGERITDKMVTSLGLEEIDCSFVPGCCEWLSFNLLSQIVLHVSKCKRRFHCAQCPDVDFNGITSYVNHCKITHGASKDSLIDQLHNLKDFLYLLSDMKISFPNGLILNKSTIVHSKFGHKLQNEFIEATGLIFESEKKSI